MNRIPETMMTHYMTRSLLVAAMGWGSLLSLAADETRQCRYAQADFAPTPGGSPLQYAPSRKVDILHLALEITPDFQQRSIRGTATLRFKPIGLPLPELELDAVDLMVDSVAASEKLLGWQATREQLVMTFEEPIAPERETTITIAYQATPKQGLYFRTPELGYRPEDTHLWTQGEPIHARHWYPGFDAPNEKFTSEITCRVPPGMVVLSNGKLMSETGEAGSDLVAVRWLQDKPHVNYLMALAAGHFQGIQDTHKSIPLAFYTPASQIHWASNSFAGTREMMTFFEEEIGVPYPWAKYYQVCAQDFVAGGMENTSLTLLTDRTLFSADFENLRSSQSLVAHELAHQWFGDLVTCKDWANLWINEGFATYYEKLYDGHKHGRDQFLYRMYQTAQGILRQPNDTNAIVRRNFKDPGEQFSYLAYPKGAWVLHMLRSQLGADLYRQCIKTFLERHAYGNAVTEDLVQVFEELSGRSLDQFFDQYVYHAHHPELNVSYRWDERAKLAKVTVQQTQKLSANVLLFNVPLPLRFKGGFGALDRMITIQKPAEDFYFSLPSSPKMVRVDPELTVLAKVTFNPPMAMVHAQLADEGDLLGRLLAVEQLSGKREALDKLAQALKNDPFYGVRIAASQAIRAIGSEAALEVLLAQSLASPPDARVRKQLAEDVTSFYREEGFEAALEIAAKEKNPDIQAVAVKALGAFGKDSVRAILEDYLATPSFRNVLGDAAVSAMRAQDDPVYLKPLLACLQTNRTAFTSRSYGAALETLARLARNEDDKTSVRAFLLEHLDAPRERIQRTAVSALGALGDAKAIAALETLTRGSEDSPLRQAAEKAIAQLRDERKPSVELSAIRKEVIALQKANQDLREDVDDLKKKIEAVGAAKETQP